MFVAQVRVETGHDNVHARLLERLKKHEQRLGWQVTLDGWITFRADERVVEAQIKNRWRSAVTGVDSRR